jgi:hypothetical protein
LADPLLLVFLIFVFEAFILLMRNQENVKLFAIISLLKILLEIGLSVVLVIVIYKTWYSRALGVLFSGAVITGLFFLSYQEKTIFGQNN